MFSAQLPAPILFHPLKHHLGYIKAFIRQNCAAPGAEINAALQTLGSSQLDLYIGPLSPPQVAREVLQHLQEHCLLQPLAYQRYLAAAGTSYRVATLSDGTDWILRWGVVEGRHVHLHPARYARHTLRVKASVLKIAIAALVAAKRRGGNTVMDTAYINGVRAAWLGLPPVKDIRLSEVLLHLIALLEDGI